jgi:hypothetical protein
MAAAADQTLRLALLIGWESLTFSPSWRAAMATGFRLLMNEA